MGEFSPINIGCLAVIHTTLAVSITATHGSSAPDADASEIRVEDTGLMCFFRGKHAPC